MSSELFAPFQLSDLTLANRMVMAPLTRNTADKKTHSDFNDGEVLSTTFQCWTDYFRISAYFFRGHWLSGYSWNI
jgi:hypothetical protein